MGDQKREVNRIPASSTKVELREYFVMAPLIIRANGGEEAGCIARKQLDEAGFKYGLMGKGTEIRQSTVEITGVQSSEGSP